tara:strand:- start:771 stop:932 length:162 start_codon:yes stop_codon:yes gene_type:complete
MKYTDNSWIQNEHVSLKKQFGLATHTEFPYSSWPNQLLALLLLLTGIEEGYKP